MTVQPLLVGESDFVASSLELLRRTVRQVAQRYRFPPPVGHDVWRPDAVDEWISDVFLPRKGSETVVRLQIAATTTNNLIAELTTTVHNVFRDESRSTVVGKMIARLTNMLPGESGLVDGTQYTGGAGSWTKPELGSAVYGGDRSELLRAPELRNLPRLGPLNTSGPTSAANRHVFEVAARTLVGLADGALRVSDIAHLIVKLYELEDPELIELDHGVTTSQSATSPPEDQLIRLETAQSIYAQLDADERMLLPHVDTPVAVVRRLLPGVTAPARRLPELRAKLTHLLIDVDEPNGVIGELLRLTDRPDESAHGH